jgi:hypothetical protein
MSKLAVFFHARISGGSMPINADGQRNVSVHPDVGRNQYVEQMKLMVDSGLYDAANEIHIGLNGEGDDEQFVQEHMPVGCILHVHGAQAVSLLPTMRLLQDWLPGHEDYLVGFAHMKGVTHPHDPFKLAWRACLERHVIKGWKDCVWLLENGHEAVGCHWVKGTDEGRPVEFFGGVFWWSTARFLLTLPPLIEKCETRAQWYVPEFFIGSGPRTPTIFDFHPGWPNQIGCERSANK